MSDTKMRPVATVRVRIEPGGYDIDVAGLDFYALRREAYRLADKVEGNTVSIVLYMEEEAEP
jgi:hypothetical protein